MNSTDHAAAPQPGMKGFREIPAEQCRKLLADNHVGRIAWHDGVRPQLLPVSYAVHEDQIVFRTSPYGMLAGLAKRTPVAFEVDEIDHEARSGWSVVVQGHARAVTEPAALVRLWTVDEPVPWASGTRNLWIAVTIGQIGGRTLSAGS